ncbi:MULTISPECIES: mercuric transporter MerT family protein [Halomonadaceae]|uniref:Mercuric transport protein MerT n=1 Tax=Modicisalibacter zincidurans TaxID=1178777 RepID=A0ABP9RAC2_9GAMM|nr:MULTISPECIES: mercuric transporter MerT family protein [Halomonas]MCD6009657.1 mercury transporter MerT [Halomonas sp. IOP_31]MEA3252930.1 mercuric transporter MerT family protein [Pseudomonadota bacterium]
MATSKDQTLDRGEQATPSRSGRKGLLAGGGAIGAVLASACCILPLVLFSLGIGGAWMSNLTMLKPYQPLFIAFTLVMLGIGFYTVYRKPSNTCRADACSTDGYCGTPLAERVIKIALWSATLLIVVVLAWPYIVPLLLG